MKMYRTIVRKSYILLLPCVGPKDCIGKMACYNILLYSVAPVCDSLNLANPGFRKPDFRISKTNSANLSMYYELFDKEALEIGLRTL